MHEFHISSSHTELYLLFLTLLRRKIACQKQTIVRVIIIIIIIIIVQTMWYGAATWGMRNAERRTVKCLDTKCLGSLVAITRMDRVRHEKVCRSDGRLTELASEVDQRILRWCGHI